MGEEPVLVAWQPNETKHKRGANIGHRHQMLHGSLYRGKSRRLVIFNAAHDSGVLVVLEVKEVLVVVSRIRRDSCACKRSRVGQGTLTNRDHLKFLSARWNIR